MGTPWMSFALSSASRSAASAGYRFSSGSNRTERQAGLAAARHERMDLIIVDVNMPVMGGLDMVAEVRKLAEYTSTPIFVLTTESSKETVLEGKTKGATAWVVKPFKEDVLLPAIRSV